jgi:hypothetical protein
MTHGKRPTAILVYLDKMLPELEALYKDIHAHPELSMQEMRTAGIAANHLRASGFEATTGVGKTGVVGMLRNGDGPGVLPVWTAHRGDVRCGGRPHGRASAEGRRPAGVQYRL